MKVATSLTACALTALLAGGASAATITFTGNETDFTSQGVPLLEDDGVDTQAFCDGLPLDIGKVYVTNDATNLYIGYQYARACFCDMNLGVAFNTRLGGRADDAFGRQIDWTNAPDKPDFMLYDVIPTGCNPYNFEALYEDSAGGWQNVSHQVNPNYDNGPSGFGSDGLGIVDTDGGNFVEIKLPVEVLSLDLTGGNCPTIGIEWWTTQEGGTKPGFDFVANDAEGRSTPSSTCFDVGPCPPSMPTIFANYLFDCATPARPSTLGRVKLLYR